MNNKGFFFKENWLNKVWDILDPDEVKELIFILVLYGCDWEYDPGEIDDKIKLAFNLIKDEIKCGQVKPSEELVKRIREVNGLDPMWKPSWCKLP